MNIESVYNNNINVAVTTSTVDDVLAASDLPKNSFIITQDSVIDSYSTHSVVMTDADGNPARLTNHFKTGESIDSSYNGLRYDNNANIYMDVDPECFTTNTSYALTLTSDIQNNLEKIMEINKDLNDSIAYYRSVIDMLLKRNGDDYYTPNYLITIDGNKINQDGNVQLDFDLNRQYIIHVESTYEVIDKFELSLVDKVNNTLKVFSTTNEKPVKTTNNNYYNEYLISFDDVDKYDTDKLAFRFEMTSTTIYKVLYYNINVTAQVSPVLTFNFDKSEYYLSYGDSCDVQIIKSKMAFDMNLLNIVFDNPYISNIVSVSKNVQTNTFTLRLTEARPQYSSASFHLMYDNKEYTDTTATVALFAQNDLYINELKTSQDGIPTDNILFNNTNTVFNIAAKTKPFYEQLSMAWIDTCDFIYSYDSKLHITSTTKQIQDSDSIRSNMSSYALTNFIGKFKNTCTGNILLYDNNLIKPEYINTKTKFTNIIPSEYIDTSRYCKIPVANDNTYITDFKLYADNNKKYNISYYIVLANQSSTVKPYSIYYDYDTNTHQDYKLDLVVSKGSGHTSNNQNSFNVHSESKYIEFNTNSQYTDNNNAYSYVCVTYFSAAYTTSTVEFPAYVVTTNSAAYNSLTHVEPPIISYQIGNSGWIRTTGFWQNVYDYKLTFLNYDVRATVFENNLNIVNGNKSNIQLSVNNRASSLLPLTVNNANMVIASSYIDVKINVDNSKQSDFNTRVGKRCTFPFSFDIMNTSTGTLTYTKQIDIVGLGTSSSPQNNTQNHGTPISGEPTGDILTPGGTSPGSNGGNSSGTNSGTSSGTNSGNSSGTNGGTSSGTNTGNGSGTNDDNTSGTNTGNNSDTNGGTSSGTEGGSPTSGSLHPGQQIDPNEVNNNTDQELTDHTENLDPNTP